MPWFLLDFVGTLSAVPAFGPITARLANSLVGRSDPLSFSTQTTNNLRGPGPERQRSRADESSGATVFTDAANQELRSAQMLESLDGSSGGLFLAS
jgi:hypothetical protein